MSPIAHGLNPTRLKKLQRRKDASRDFETDFYRYASCATDVKTKGAARGKDIFGTRRAHVRIFRSNDIAARSDLINFSQDVARRIANLMERDITAMLIGDSLNWY